jgi:hypothetical protein
MIRSFTFDQDDLIRLAVAEVVKTVGGAFKPSDLTAGIYFPSSLESGEDLLLRLQTEQSSNDQLGAKHRVEIVVTELPPGSRLRP